MIFGSDTPFGAFLLRRQNGELAEAFERFTIALQGGEIQLPSSSQVIPVLAGGNNHCPNSDLSYSKNAATIAGTLPADAGDGNQECFRFYWVERGADVVLDHAHTLKAVGHSLYAAAEGADSAIPIWNRVDGWGIIGAEGATQYDIVVQMPAKVVGGSQRWYVRIKLASLNSAFVPSNVEASAGFWHKHGGSEGYIEGSAFDLDYEVVGVPGSTSIDYRVLAKTDSGVSILSNVLTVPNAPDTLSASNFVRIFHAAGPGFITFEIYRKLGGVFYHLFTIRNSTDLYYNDDGQVRIGQVAGWPVEPQNKPQAYAETRTVRVGAFNGAWRTNDLTIEVPAGYDYSQTDSDGLFFRFGLTNPTGVDRHVGFDQIWLSTTNNAWSPDPPIKFSDGSTAIPSISPTSGSQGGEVGVTEPFPGGSGGGTCIVTTLPVLMKGGRFKQYRNVELGNKVRGEHREPYTVLAKPQGTAAEHYLFKTANGITYDCNGEHDLLRDWSERVFIKAKQLKVGTRLPAWVKGRKTYTIVKSIQFIPEPVEVGTFVLRHSVERDGHGIYIAGRSKLMDRGLPSSNVKRGGEDQL